MRGFRLALLFTSASLFAAIASAQDPYTGFRVPEARSFTWLVNGNAQWSQRVDAFPGTHSEDRDALGELRSSAHRHAESEAFTSDLLLQALGSWATTRSTNRFESIGGASGGDRDFTNDAYQLSVSAATTRYLGHSGWGIDATAFAEYEYTRFGSAFGLTQDLGSSRSENREDAEAHFYDGQVNALLGPGYGRVRDVTGVFDMQVIEERLEATGRLLHPLSPAARQRLAELFSVSGDFLAAHDRPDRYLWRDVERLLREDGAIAEGTFDAWSLMRALEPATLSIAVTRLAGWRVTGAYQVALSRGHIDSDHRSTFADYSGGVLTSISELESSSHTSLDRSRGFGRLDAAWHRPLGMRWQVDASGAGHYGDGPRRLVQLGAALGITYVLADRWVVTASASDLAASLVADSVRTSPSWVVRGAAQLSYFFEDSWSITAGVDHFQARPFLSNGNDPASPEGYARQTQAVFGITYRPIGRFEAPGLHVSERLAPGGI